LLGLLLAVLVGLILDLPQQRDDLLHVTASRNRTGAPRIMKSTEKNRSVKHTKIGQTRERQRTGARHLNPRLAPPRPKRYRQRSAPDPTSETKRRARTALVGEIRGGTCRARGRSRPCRAASCRRGAHRRGHWPLRHACRRPLPFPSPSPPTSPVTERPETTASLRVHAGLCRLWRELDTLNFANVFEFGTSQSFDQDLMAQIYEWCSIINLL
jgi:hypothetical protein